MTSQSFKFATFFRRATSLLGLIGAALGISTLVIGVAVALDGIVLLAYWRWFVLPFIHIQPPNYPTAMALAFLFHYLAQEAKMPDDKADAGFASVIMLTLGRPTIMLVVGFVLHLFAK